MVIEQYTVTTQRYNFPQPGTDSFFPQRLLEQSMHSLRLASRHLTNPNQKNIQRFDCFERPFSLSLRPEPILLIQRTQETFVAAVDSSTIKIGETPKGIVVAVRGATVWKQNHLYHYTRLGPFIFHVTEDNKRELCTTLEKAYFPATINTKHQFAPTLLQMPTRIASMLERWIQNAIAKSASNSLILFDGSLTSGTADAPVARMRETLDAARKRGNVVLAFSKATSLRVNGYLITEQLPATEPPYLLETSNLKLKPPTILLGEVYVARLSKAKMAFRLDIDRELPAAHRVEAVEKLIGNDLYLQSYPETLRLAHILCTFTASEVLAMQRFAVRKHGIRLVNRPDMHRLLFGAYGKGEGHA